MKNEKEETIEVQIQKSLVKLIELSEKKIIIDLYLAHANRNQIKAVVVVGTKKVDKIISKIKSLRVEKRDGKKEIE
jgi:hypothetical protein